MVVDMYIIGPKKDRFKLVFFGLFDFSKMKRPRPRLQKTNKQSFLVLVLFGLSPVQLQSFASPRTGLSNTTHNMGPNTWHLHRMRWRYVASSAEEMANNSVANGSGWVVAPSCTDSFTFALAVVPAPTDQQNTEMLCSVLQWHSTTVRSPPVQWHKICLKVNLNAIQTI